jgi:hypothetical protein
MSDWTSGFQAFNQGMGMLADANERKRRQKLEEERMGYEKERLGIEKDRATRQAGTDALTAELLGLKKAGVAKSLQPPTAPSGMRTSKLTPNEYGGLEPSFEPVPMEPKIIEVNGRKFIFNPNTGAVEELKRDWMSTFLNGGGLSPTGDAPPAPAGSEAPGVSAPAAPTALGTPAPSVQPPWRVSGVSPSGPTLEPVYPTKPPEIVERPLPNGGKGMFIRTIDPKSNKEDLTPYNQPDSANKISDKTVTLQNLNAARRYAQQLKEVIDRSGTWESRMGSRQDAAALEQIPYLMAISMAKILDPGSVAREGEVDAAKKYLIPLGAFANADVAKASIDRLVTDLDTRAKDLGLEAPQVPGESAAPAAPADGPARVSTKAQYDALPPGTLYVDDSGKPKRKP